MKYLILEQGQYSDYSMSFVDITGVDINRAEILKLLNFNSYDEIEISGEINGELILERYTINNLKTLGAEQINRFVSAYKHKEVNSILDREYSKEELLEVALKNDKSSTEYWNTRIDNNYENYKIAYSIYKKLI